MKIFFTVFLLAFSLDAGEITCEDGKKVCLAMGEDKTHRSMYLVNMNDYPIWVQRAAVRVNEQKVDIDGKTFEANSTTELIREKKTYYKFDKTAEREMHIVKWLYFGTVDKKTFEKK